MFCIKFRNRGKIHLDTCKSQHSVHFMAVEKVFSCYVEVQRRKLQWFFEHRLWHCNLKAVYKQN